MYERKQVELMVQRIMEPKKTIMVISGPRQCGKTTAVGQMIEKCGIPDFSFSADNVISDSNSWIIERWESARNSMDAKGLSEAVLVIDEVQKIKNWSEAVKSEWDYDKKKGRNLKVVLLGSSRVLLQKGLEESLAGRFEKIDMTYWTFDEMNQAFGMSRDEYIYFGGFPGLYDYIGDEERWRNFMTNSIVIPFLQRDLNEIEEIRNPALMNRIFSVGSAMSSKVISINKLRSELNNGSNPTVKNYLDLLDKTMMLKPIYKYRFSVPDGNNSSPKMQVYNNGFLTVSNNVRFIDVRSNNAMWGQWLESAVGAYLLSQSSTYAYDVMYWRENKNFKDKYGKTRQGIFEVDYILRKGTSIVAIEVKSNRVDTLSGIEEFKKMFHEGSSDKLVMSLVVGNQGLTFEEFCKIDLNQLFVDKNLSAITNQSFPTSRLDRGQKEQLSLIGRVNGSVWIDGDDFLIQKDEKGMYLTMKCSEAFEILKNNTPELLSNLGLSSISVLQDLAKGHTIPVGKENLFFDINTHSIKNGISYVQALIAQKEKTNKPIDKELKTRFGID